MRSRNCSRLARVSMARSPDFLALLGLVAVASPSVAENALPTDEESLRTAFIDYSMTCLEAQQMEAPGEEFFAAAGYSPVKPPEGFEEKVLLYRKPGAFHLVTYDIPTKTCTVRWESELKERDEILVESLAREFQDRVSEDLGLSFQIGDTMRRNRTFYYGFTSGHASGTLTAESSDNGTVLMFGFSNTNHILRMLSKEPAKQ